MDEKQKSLVEMVIEASRRPVSDRPDPVSDTLIAKLMKSRSEGTSN